MKNLMLLAVAWVRVHLLARGGPRCQCPACDRTEQGARAALGMPQRHPEWITGLLPARDELRLSALAEALWPGAGYADIITELRPED